MVKPFDLSRFRKTVTSKIEGLATGFHNPSAWISTNNYTLNYLISNDFKRGIPMGQVTLLAGESGSGKSFIAANVIRNALEQGHQVIVLDSEWGWTKDWAEKAGIDVDKYYGTFLLRESVAQIDAAAQYIALFMKDFKKEYASIDPDERPKVLFVIDSLTQLLTRTDEAQFESGDVSKGDMGRQAKALKAFVKNCTVQFADWDIGLLATNHSYASQDMFDPDDKITGGQGFIYASSIVVAMKKRKLKEDEDGNKITDVSGIRADIKVMKSRYTKPFEKVEVKIPYESGIDPYSGLVELFEKQGLLEKDGNKLKYIDSEGTEHKYFRKYFNTDDGHSLLDLIMREHEDKVKTITEDQDILEGFAEEENGSDE